LAHNLAVLEQQQRRDRPHAVLLRDDLVAIDVHLRHLQLAFEVIGDRIDHRCDRLAGAAPYGPEIHERWELRLEDFRLEIGIGELLDVRPGHVTLRFPGLYLSTALPRRWQLTD